MVNPTVGLNKDFISKLWNIYHAHDNDNENLKPDVPYVIYLNFQQYFIADVISEGNGNWFR